MHALYRALRLALQALYTVLRLALQALDKELNTYKERPKDQGEPLWWPLTRHES